MLPTTADGTPLCGARRPPPQPARLGQAVEASRGPARGRRDQPRGRRRSASRGSTATAAGSRRSGSSPRRSRSCARRRRSTRPPDRLIEAADWIVWQLTGVETRNSCTAGYKALWSAEDGFPSEAVLRGAGPAVRAGRGRQDEPVDRGASARRPGGLSERRPRAGPGLPAGIAVAVANVDAHVSAPGRRPSPSRASLVAIMGTSTCHVILSDTAPAIAGMCGVVRDGVVPGLFGFEAGQASVGDLFGWFVEHAVPPRYFERAASARARRPRRARGRGGEAARRASPGSSRSTGGTATARSWSTPTCRGCSSGMTMATGAGRDLPGPDRGDRVRDARDHRRPRGRRGPGRAAWSRAAGCPSGTASSCRSTPT